MLYFGKVIAKAFRDLVRFRRRLSQELREGKQGNCNSMSAEALEKSQA